MKEKLKDYIETIFADAPDTVRIRELKEEMLCNLNDRFDDLVAEGKSEATAFNIAIAGIGDVSSLINETAQKSKTEFVGEENEKNTKDAATKTPKPEREMTREEKAAYNSYKNRNAIMMAIAIALYILCVVPVILMDGNVVGIMLMFIMIALATGTIIFKSMMPKPDFFGNNTENTANNATTAHIHNGHEHHDAHRHEEKKVSKAERNPVYKAIAAAFWMIVVCAYLIVSFLTQCWHITWLMFLIATAIDNIIKAAFEIKG